MTKKKRKFSKEFKENAVAYIKGHPELTMAECARNLGTGKSTLNRWISQHGKSSQAFPGSGNYSNEDAKEIARLRRELRNTQDALEILKKAIGILGE